MAARREPAPALAPGGPATVARTDEAAIGAGLRALQAALAGGDDEGARRVLSGLRAHSTLSARETELVASAERVLAGRALVRGLELALQSEPVPEQAGVYRLLLVARSNASSDVRLRLPPADLKRLRTTMDAKGLEGMDYESKACQALDDLVLVPTVVRRIELLRYELPLGRALAVRERWRLEPRSGEIDCAGVVHPAANVRVQGCEREKLSPLLAAEAVSATALAERLAAEAPARERELLELALRTRVDEREACLDALTPIVARLAKSAPERVAAAEPALRWLTQNRDLGPDAAAWSRFLAARRRPAGTPNAPVDGLDLPDRPRSAQRAEEGPR
ncbi:MAG: hypothetical protein EXS08_05640 [Planctomycetes bacterium]|nr:hypothetical protein [Planctomycetota bacterium]